MGLCRIKLAISINGDDRTIALLLGLCRRGHDRSALAAVFSKREHLTVKINNGRSPAIRAAVINDQHRPSRFKRFHDNISKGFSVIIERNNH